MILNYLASLFFGIFSPRQECGRISLLLLKYVFQQSREKMPRFALVGVGVGFASYYADNMVLQRAPVNATVWGYASAVGDDVTVTLTSALNKSSTVSGVAYEGRRFV